MKRYNSQVHFDFLNGFYNELFKECETYPEPPTDSEAIHVSRLDDNCACDVRRNTGSCTHNARYAVLIRDEGHFARVVTSNCKRLRSGVKVRIGGQWDYLSSTLDDSHQDTVGAPGMLEIPGQPRKKPQRGHQPQVKKPQRKSA